MIKPSLILSLLLALSAASTPAADQPNDIVKYRQSVMKSMGAHMSAMTLVAKKQISNRSQLAAHAEAIHGVSVGLDTLFPAGSGPDKVKTAATPDVWTHWRDFTAAAQQLEQESAKLTAIAKRGDERAFSDQLEQVGAACGACHKPFRVHDN